MALSYEEHIARMKAEFFRFRRRKSEHSKYVQFSDANKGELLTLIGEWPGGHKNKQDKRSLAKWFKKSPLDSTKFSRLETKQGLFRAVARVFLFVCPTQRMFTLCQRYCHLAKTTVFPGYLTFIELELKSGEQYLSWGNIYQITSDSLVATFMTSESLILYTIMNLPTAEMATTIKVALDAICESSARLYGKVVVPFYHTELLKCLTAKLKKHQVLGEIRSTSPDTTKKTATPNWTESESEIYDLDYSVKMSFSPVVSKYLAAAFVRYGNRITRSDKTYSDSPDNLTDLLLKYGYMQMKAEQFISKNYDGDFTHKFKQETEAPISLDPLTYLASKSFSLKLIIKELTDLNIEATQKIPAVTVDVNIQHDRWTSVPSFRKFSSEMDFENLDANDPDRN